LGLRHCRHERDEGIPDGLLHRLLGSPIEDQPIDDGPNNDAPSNEVPDRIGQGSILPFPYLSMKAQCNICCNTDRQRNGKTRKFRRTEKAR
jgi:hypothetical protein